MPPRYFPNRDVELERYISRILTPTSPEFNTGNVIQFSRGSANAAWPSANDPVALPFRISQSMVIAEFGWLNGSGTMTDSIDVGVYDANFVRLVSTGGIARSGASTWQWSNVTDTWIGAGDYYLAASNNGVTANNQFWLGVSGTAAAGVLAFYGVKDSATDAYPLPDPLTNMADAATFTRAPYLAIATRAHF